MEEEVKLTNSERLHDDTLRQIINCRTVSAGDEIKISIAAELLERRNQVLDLTRQRDMYARRHSDLGVLYCKEKAEQSSLINLLLEWDELTNTDLDVLTHEEVDQVFVKAADLADRVKFALSEIRKKYDNEMSAQT